MLISSKQSPPDKAGIDWLGIKKTFIVQIVVLLVAAIAVIQYINWSSRVAQVEFARAIKPMMLDKTPPFKSPDPIVNARKSGDRRAHA
jgi:hypothetical protein